MSEASVQGTQHVGDLIALAVQRLRREDKLGGNHPLIRIDNRDAAARAPFQFDTVRGRLHRTGCRAIPQSSRSALYGMWRIDLVDTKLACPRCNPLKKTNGSDDPYESQDDVSDLLYGVLAIIDQFGGVLRERGREYRKSRQGRQIGENLDGVYANLGSREREVFGVILSSLTEVTGKLRDLEAELRDDQPSNGANGKKAQPSNGQGDSHTGESMRDAEN